MSRSSSISASLPASPSLSQSSSPDTSRPTSPSSSMSSFITLSNPVSLSSSHPILSDPPVIKQRIRSSSHNNVPILTNSISDTTSTRSLSDITSSRSHRTRRFALIKAIMALYDTSISVDQLDILTWPYLSPTIRFSDPLVTVHGIDDYKAQFLGLRRIFPVMRVLEIHTSGTNDRLVVDAIVEYRLAKYIPIVLHQVTVCKITDSGFGVVYDHHDIWSLRDVIDAVPIVGYCYTQFRNILGITSSWLLKQAFADHKKGTHIGTPSSTHISPREMLEKNGNEGMHRGHSHGNIRNYATLRL